MENNALLVARLVLALVFAVAGLTKLVDRNGTARAMREFGLPRPLAAPAGVLLPLAELAVAVALLLARAAWLGAIGALALLLLFIAGIAVNLARGRKPDCHCFGQLASEPIGMGTVVRNVALAAIAAFVVVRGGANAGGSAVAWIGDLQAMQQIAIVLGIGLLLLVGAEAWVLLQLLRQGGRMLVQIEALEQRIAAAGAAPFSSGADAAAPEPPPAAGLPVGAPAPAFSLPGLFGEMLTLDALRSAGKPLLLTFTDPNCGPCQALLPDLGRWQRELAPNLTLALISRGSADENRGKSSEHGLTQVLLQQDREVMEGYRANGTPAAVLVRPDGTVGSALAQGAEEIRAGVARSASGNVPAALPFAAYPPVPAAGDGRCPQCGQYHGNAAAPVEPQGLAVGTPAPALKLPDLAGSEIDLGDYRGRETVVLFWNPGCGFCQQLLPDLKAWEGARPDDAPALLVVSTGTAEANQAHGLSSTIVLDQNFATGGAFGASGTPSAVKVGKDGSIAAPMVVGGPGVMGLLSGQTVPAATSASLPVTVRVGDPVPDFSLPDLDGNSMSPAGFRGRETVLLFWNPDCGFCQQMLQDLRAWEMERRQGAPEILIVSTGAAQENRMLGLRSPIVLDSGMSLGQQLGAMGTPMAVLVDAQGRVASEAAAGAEAVLALARGGTRSS
jgi:peroxiredoxin